MSNPNRPPWRTLAQELDELERTDPLVKAAAESYRRTVDRLNARARRRAMKELP